MPTSVRLQAETAARVSAQRQPRASGQARRAGGVCTHVCMCVGGWFSAAPRGGRQDSPSQSHRPDVGGHSC